jgi:hypothetical protein
MCSWRIWKVVIDLTGLQARQMYELLLLLVKHYEHNNENIFATHRGILVSTYWCLPWLPVSENVRNYLFLGKCWIIKSLTSCSLHKSPRSTTQLAVELFCTSLTIVTTTMARRACPPTAALFECFQLHPNRTALFEKRNGGSNLQCCEYQRFYRRWEFVIGIGIDFPSQKSPSISALLAYVAKVRKNDINITLFV